MSPSTCPPSRRRRSNGSDARLLPELLKRRRMLCATISQTRSTARRSSGSSARCDGRRAPASARGTGSSSSPSPRRAASSPGSRARRSTSRWACRPGSRSRRSTSSSASARREPTTSATRRRTSWSTAAEITWPAPYWYVDSGSLFMLIQLAALSEGLGAGVYGVPGEGRPRAQAAARDAGRCSLQLHRHDRQAASRHGRQPARLPADAAASPARTARALGSTGTARGARKGFTTATPSARRHPYCRPHVRPSPRRRCGHCGVPARRRLPCPCQRAVRRSRRSRPCR